MKVFLIEDENHKANDLKTRLSECEVDICSLVEGKGVREAVLEVSKEKFDLIILDMALPTFAGSSSVGGGGAAQAVGGIEILRMLKMKGYSSKVIIVTQYPDIIIDGRKIKLTQVGKLISAKYNQNVLGAVLYTYNTSGWGHQFDALVRRARCE